MAANALSQESSAVSKDERKALENRISNYLQKDRADSLGFAQNDWNFLFWSSEFSPRDPRFTRPDRIVDMWRNCMDYDSETHIHRWTQSRALAWLTDNVNVDSARRFFTGRQSADDAQPLSIFGFFTKGIRCSTSFKKVT